MQKAIFKKIKAITPSQRALKALVKPSFWSQKHLKSRTFGTCRKAGRNHRGQITFSHRGGGHKRLYRSIDFARQNLEGVVQGIEYDPFRKAFLARMFNPQNKQFYYILAPKNLFIGSVVFSGEKAEIKLGHALPFAKIPVGMLLHNISCVEKKKVNLLALQAPLHSLYKKQKDLLGFD